MCEKCAYWNSDIRACMIHNTIPGGCEDGKVEHMHNKYIMRRGKQSDFLEDLLVPGEAVAITDKHTLAFCFEKGDVSYLNFDETVSEETAKELSSRIKQFIENSYGISADRINGRGYGK